METTVFFKEIQKFRQKWLWALMLGVGVGTNGLFLYGVIQQVIFGQLFGNKPASDTMLLIIFGSNLLITILITLLLAYSRLETQIREDGIYMKYFPIHSAYKKFAWTEISKAYVRKYDAIVEYGGWGIRCGFNFKVKAYNVSGNKGLQLEFISGKKILIGTNKPKELTEILISMGKLKQ